MTRSWYSPLRFLHTNARDAMVGPASPQEASERKLLASPPFADLLTATNDERDVAGHAARVALCVAMLERVALDPRDLDATRDELMRGGVHLHFFGVASPVPWFHVEVGSSDHQQLLQTFDRNANGPLLRAAKRMRRLRESRRVMRAIERENIILKRMRDRMTWPAHPSVAQGVGPFNVSVSQKTAYSAAHDACMRQLDDKVAQMREVRRRRVAMLDAATRSGLGSWSEMCLDLARAVLLPMLSAEAVVA